VFFPPFVVEICRADFPSCWSSKRSPAFRFIYAEVSFLFDEIGESPHKVFPSRLIGRSWDRWVRGAHLFFCGIMRKTFLSSPFGWYSALPFRSHKGKKTPPSSSRASKSCVFGDSQVSSFYADDRCCRRAFQSPSSDLSPFSWHSHHQLVDPEPVQAPLHFSATLLPVSSVPFLFFFPSVWKWSALPTFSLPLLVSLPPFSAHQSARPLVIAIGVSFLPSHVGGSPVRGLKRLLADFVGVAPWRAER